MSEKQFAREDHAKIYSSYRRDNPTEVVEKIISFLKEKVPEPLGTAVDVGCGNGQSTVILAPYFKRVHGSDVSEAQIGQAKENRSLPNVTYAVSPAEKLPFEDGSVQLLTAATALHWFDLDAFLPEARRLLCVNGVMAVYGYRRMQPLFEDEQKCAQIDEIYDEFNRTKRAFSMESNVQMMKDNYKDVTFPFEEIIRCPDIRCTFEGKLSDVVNYVSTYSGFQNFMKVDGKAAEKSLDTFRNRLYEIGASCNYSAEDSITLFRDYKLILCRKTKEGQFGDHIQNIRNANFRFQKE